MNRRSKTTRGAVRSASYRSTRQGTAAAEAAFVFTLLVPLLLGSWEVGRIVEVQEVLNNAVREGARQAASGQLTAAQVQQVVSYYIKDAGLPTANAVVTVQDLTTPAADPTTAAEFDNLKVSVTMPFKDVRWSTALFVTNNSTNLTAAATWLSANGSAYPTNITVPSGY